MALPIALAEPASAFGMMKGCSVRERRSWLEVKRWLSVDDDDRVQNPSRSAAAVHLVWLA